MLTAKQRRKELIGLAMKTEEWKKEEEAVEKVAEESLNDLCANFTLDFKVTDGMKCRLEDLGYSVDFESQAYENGTSYQTKVKC